MSETGGEVGTAYCKDDSKYNPGKPILSITFSMAESKSFDVSIKATSREGALKIFPILYEIKDLTKSNIDSIIKPLKNKACIAKNMPNDLAEHLSFLNSLLLDEYVSFYDERALKLVKEAQDDFSKGIVKRIDKKQGTTTEYIKALEGWGSDTAKDLIEEKIKEYRANPPSENVKIEQITKLVNENNNNDAKNSERIKYNTAVLKDALYVGKYKFDDKSPDFHLFLTIYGILSDGYAVLPDTKDLDITGDIIGIGFTNPYSKLWKLANVDGNGGGHAGRVVAGGPDKQLFKYDDIEKLLGDKTYTTEYDRAIYFLKKDQKYGGQRTLSNRPRKKHRTRRRV